MSFVYDKGEIKTSREYLLSESIQPVVTEFGVDLRDRQWVSVNGGKYTFFKDGSKEIYYMVLLHDTGEVGFGSSDKWIDPYNMAQLQKEFSGGKKQKSGNALRVFNNFFYVVMEGVKKYNVKKVFFDAEDPQLGFIYRKVVSNKYFLGKMRDLGFNYVGKSNEDFVFERI